MPSWTGQIADDCFPRAAIAVTRPSWWERALRVKLAQGCSPAGRLSQKHRARACARSSASLCGSAPQIKSGAGPAREALSPVRSPAGRLPLNPSVARRVGSTTCNDKLPTEPVQGNPCDCAPLWEPTLWATCPTKSISLRLIHLRALGTELRGLLGHAFGQRVSGIGHAFVGGVFAHVLGDLH